MDKAMQQGGEQQGAGLIQGAQGAQGGQGDERAANAYQRILTAAGKVIYDKSITPQLLQIVKNSASGIEGVVAATMVVLDELRGKVTGINPNFVYTVSMTVALLIAEMAEAAKIIRADPAKVQQYQQALMQALMKELQKRAEQGGGQPAQAAQGAPAAAQPGADAPHGEMPTGGAEALEDEAVEDDETDEEAGV